MLATRAYLFSLAPVYQPNRGHELRWYLSDRMIIGLWKGLYYKRGRFEPDPDRSEEWNRGAYLVTGPAHCGECHTSRRPSGALKTHLPLAGSRDGPEGNLAPNITPDEETGIGGWDKGDIVWFLETGSYPDGEQAEGLMAEVIEHGLGKLGKEDLEAIAVYLKSLPPIRNKLAR